MRKFNASELVLATHNKGKVAEFADFLSPLGVSVMDAAQAGLDDPEETGVTFTENAILKARLAAEATGKVALADDSGLAVAALGGDPGIFSARWAEDADGKRDFQAAMTLVLEKMVGQVDRRAAFVAVLAVVWPDGHSEAFEGRVEGDIVETITGEKGFGYDPIFQPNGHDRTFGQMEPEEKKALSHRARAVEKLFTECFAPLK